MGSLLRRLWSMYSVSGASNLPDSASTRLDGLVGHSGGADTCTRSRFDTSSALWWTQVGVRSYGMIGRWIGWPRYVIRRPFIPSVLTRLDSS